MIEPLVSRFSSISNLRFKFIFAPTVLSNVSLHPFTVSSLVGP